MMKKSKKFTIILGVLITLVMPLVGHASKADAATFLGMKPWYEGLTHMEGTEERLDCVIDKANADETTGGRDKATGCWGLAPFVWTAATNVASDLAIIAALGAIGFVIYGGYLYIFSGGDSTKVYTGKKTIMNAIIGLAIAMLANIIFTAIRAVLLHDGNFGKIDVDGDYYTAHLVQLSDPGLVVTDLIAWAVGFAGIVCAIFLVYGGVGYMTANGDANKITKAKNAILSAVIGLAIVAFAEVITAVAANMIRDSISKAETTSSINLQIGKETNEKIN